MLEKLKQLVGEGKLTHEEVLSMAKHFTTPAGDPVEYSWEGMNQYKGALSKKEAGAFLLLMTKAKLNGMMNIHGVISTNRQELDIKSILENKGEIALKPGWARAIRQYSQEQKRG